VSICERHARELAYKPEIAVDCPIFCTDWIVSVAQLRNLDPTAPGGVRSDTLPETITVRPCATINIHSPLPTLLKETLGLSKGLFLFSGVESPRGINFINTLSERLVVWWAT